MVGLSLMVCRLLDIRRSHCTAAVPWLRNQLLRMQSQNLTSGSYWQGDDEESSSSAASSSQSGGAASAQPGFYDGQQVCLAVLCLSTLCLPVLCLTHNQVILISMLMVPLLQKAKPRKASGHVMEKPCMSTGSEDRNTAQCKRHE